MLPLTKYELTVQTIIIVPLTLSPSCLLSLVRLGAYTVSDIPSTAGRLHSEFVLLLFLQAHRETDRFFFQLQEFSFRNLPVDSSTSAARRSPHSSSLKWATFSPRLQHYGLS
jgi:hypothetical protein